MRALTPEFSKQAPVTVLTITTVGDPNKIAGPSIGALYGTAYTTKFKVFRPKKKVMEIGCLSCFWPDAHKKPKARWKGIWGLVVSSFVKQSQLLQKDPAHPVKVARWRYGTVAQILHVGPYHTEEPTIRKLHAFIKEKGYRIVGPHEEIYLTRPSVKKPKTVIRYVVEKKKRKR